jgi:hypothetical protein
MLYISQEPSCHRTRSDSGLRTISTRVTRYRERTDTTHAEPQQTHTHTHTQNVRETHTHTHTHTSMQIHNNIHTDTQHSSIQTPTHTNTTQTDTQTHRHADHIRTQTRRRLILRTPLSRCETPQRSHRTPKDPPTSSRSSCSDQLLSCRSSLRRMKSGATPPLAHSPPLLHLRSRSSRARSPLL